MSHLTDTDHKKIITRIFYIIITSIAIWLFVKYLLKPLLPFIFAWLIALLLQPAINYICKRSKLPRKVISFVLVFIALTLSIMLLYFFSMRIFSEIREIFQDLSSDINNVISDIFSAFDSLTSRLSISGDKNSQNTILIKNAIKELANSSISEISSCIPSKIMALASSLPSLIFFILVLIIASFYMSMDLKKINAFFGDMLPDNIRIKLRSAKNKMIKDGLKYIRAYLIILIITFIQLLIGFLLLKVPYALTLALIIAVIDILPVLGVGTVLIPWASILFIRHDYYLGIGLIIVFAVIYVSRQIIEPKILSVSIGLSPLVILIAMYTGIKLMGIGGIFVFPLGIIFFKNIIDCGIFRSENKNLDKKSTNTLNTNTK